MIDFLLVVCILVGAFVIVTGMWALMVMLVRRTNIKNALQFLYSRVLMNVVILFQAFIITLLILGKI